MLEMRYLVVATLLLSLGCSHSDLCPDGTASNGSRCVSDDPAEPDPDGSTDFEDADAPPTDAERPDELDTATSSPNDAADAGGDDTGADGETDATSPPATPDAVAGPDSNADANLADGAPITPDVGPVGGPNQCSDDAVDAWRRFQMSANAVPSILACYAADPGCKDGSCNIDACLKGAAGMVGCDACVAAENQCVTKNCATVCGVSTDDDACRACACAARCFDAPDGCGVRNVDACADCKGPSCSARLAARSETITVPIMFHFVYDRTDPTTGLPAYVTDSLTNETMHDIDAQLQRSNGILEAARSDARRLQLVRAGVVYVAASAAGSCPDPVAIIGPNRLFRAINVVLTRTSATCPSASINAYAARASGRTLLHEVAHTLGLQDTSAGNTASSTVELLYRDRDPTSSTSCYARGDFVCDTPPDYGHAGDNRCGSVLAGSNLCTQNDLSPFDGRLAPCNAQDPIVDGTGVCSALGNGGRRTYDPERLGLFSDRPANVMSSHDQATLTPEQLLRMHNYAQWRLSAVGRVPQAERRLLSGIMHGPNEPLWERAPHRDYGLVNAHVASASLPGPFDLPDTLTFEAKSFDARGAVLGLRFSAALEGTPSDALRVIIAPHGKETVELSRSSVQIKNGMMWVDEVFLPAPGPSPLAKLRGYRSATIWSIRVQDSVALRLRDARLELVQSDRIQFNNDRHARGCSDILVYRPSASVLLTAASPCNGTFVFGRPVAESIPMLPDPAAHVTSGDVDGDSGVDLLARRGASLWIAFHADSYAIWRAGSIAGSDLPNASDEVLMGDFDGDGYGDLLRRRADLATNVSRFAFYRGVGDGRFEALRRPNFGYAEDHPLRDAHSGPDIRWAIGDIVGHGVCDLVSREAGSDLLWFSHNLSAPPSTAGVLPTFYGAWTPEMGDWTAFAADSGELLVMDVNQDGTADLVTRQGATGKWQTYLKIPMTLRYSNPRPITFGGNTPPFLDTDLVLGTVQ